MSKATYYKVSDPGPVYKMPINGPKVYIDQFAGAGNPDYVADGSIEKPYRCIDEWYASQP